MKLISLIGELAALHAKHGGEIEVVSDYSCLGDRIEAPYFDEPHNVIVV